MPTITLQPAAPEDMDELAEILHRSYQQAYYQFGAKELADDTTYQFIRGEIFNAYPDTIMAMIDGKKAGLLIYQENIIHTLFIDPTHQGQGLGTQLLNHTCEIIRKKGYSFAEVEALEENLIARDFFSNQGGYLHKIEQRLVRDKFPVMMVTYRFDVTSLSTKDGSPQIH